MIHANSKYNVIHDHGELIPEDEPVFLLRAQDKCASDSVRNWAVLMAHSGAKADIIDAAYAHASLMDQWAKKKIANM